MFQRNWPAAMLISGAAVMLVICISDGNSGSSWWAGSFGSAHQEEPALSAPKRLFSLPHIIPFIIQSNVALFWLMIYMCTHITYIIQYILCTEVFKSKNCMFNINYLLWPVFIAFTDPCISLIPPNECTDLLVEPRYTKQIATPIKT